MRKFNIHPSKSLGQNFLIDESILERIIVAAGLDKSDLALEVGPGLGGLTAKIAEASGMVVAVEKDKRLLPVLNENLKAYPNIKIINGDILKLDIAGELEKALSENMGGSAPNSIKIVANLPYYITTPIIMKLLESGIKAKSMVFMVQKEVADRMAAAPGGKEYGALSVSIQYYSRPSIITKVSPHSFIPPPEVDSAVIKLDMYEKPPVDVEDCALFFRIVKAAFAQRRKTLANALHNAGYIDADKEKLKSMLNEIGIDENQRGETLTLEQFAQLSNRVFRATASENKKPGAPGF